MRRATANSTIILMFIAATCAAETIDVTLHIMKNYGNTPPEKFITIENLRKLKQVILDGGKTQTYCNMYSHNPAHESKSYWFYLNPDDGQKNINSDRTKGDFSRLMIRKKAHGRHQYLLVDFRDSNMIALSISSPSDDLSVKEIRAFAENALGEVLDMK